MDSDKWQLHFLQDLLLESVSANWWGSYCLRVEWGTTTSTRFSFSEVPPVNLQEDAEAEKFNRREQCFFCFTSTFLFKCKGIQTLKCTSGRPSYLTEKELELHRRWGQWFKEGNERSRLRYPFARSRSRGFVAFEAIAMASRLTQFFALLRDVPGLCWSFLGVRMSQTGMPY